MPERFEIYTVYKMALSNQVYFRQHMAHKNYKKDRQTDIRTYSI